MKKAQFIQALKDKLISLGKEIDEKQINSAVGKTGRAMIAREGVIEWSEDEVGNAVAFYFEYKKAKTFNRTNYRNNR